MIPAVFYYATPWLLRLLAAVLALAAFRHWGVRAMAVTCALVSLLEGVRSFRLDDLPPAPAGGPVVSVWNAGRALDRKPAAWPELAASDVSAVIECGTFDERMAPLHRRDPDHEWRRFDGSTMLGVRGKIMSHESLGVHDLFRCHRVRVALPRPRRADGGRRRYPLATMDFPRASLAAILRAAGDDPRAIILGDFNTPPESVWFREWRTRGFTLANDAPRRGFRETWAYGLPLLTLDHVWLAPGWRALRCERLRLGSDHLAVKVELSS